MKVIVKNFPVRYKGKRYYPGEKLDIDTKAFSEKLFEKEGKEEKAPAE